MRNGKRWNSLKPVKFGRFVFDNFREKGLLHLLSHAHSDHTSGLKNNWMKAPILCTDITVEIILTRFNLIPKSIFILKQPGELVELDDIEIQIVDANHCPGSVMFSCKSNKSQQKVVFTGDFRLNDNIRENIDQFTNADIMYLDCTFNKPIFQFPSQTQAISEVINIIEKNSNQNINIGVYSIGKNKLIQAISEHFTTRIYTPKKLYDVYKAIGMNKFVTTKKSNAWIHSYPRHYMERKTLEIDGVVKIIPTGWACINRSNPENHFYYVPYSEHNDYNLLNEFIRLTKPKKIVPIHGKLNPISTRFINNQENKYQATL